MIVIFVEACSCPNKDRNEIPMLLRSMPNREEVDIYFFKKSNNSFVKFSQFTSIFQKNI